MVGTRKKKRLEQQHPRGATVDVLVTRRGGEEEDIPPTLAGNNSPSARCLNTDDTDHGQERSLDQTRGTANRTTKKRGQGQKTPPVDASREREQQGLEQHGRELILSGTLHLAYDRGEDLSLDVSLLRKETEHVVPSRRGGKHGEARGGTISNRSGVTLLDLVKRGLLKPGNNVIECRYKRATGTASLTEAGTIQYDGEEFSSATAFSIFFKRTFTPSKLGDDGWKSVYYRGQCLDVYRKEYEAKTESIPGSTKKARRHGAS